MRSYPVSETFKLNDNEISSIEIEDLNFRNFSQIARKAAKGDGRIDTVLTRLRMMHQVTCVAADSTKVKLTELDIMSLPPKIGKLIAQNLTGDEGEGGKVIGENDGISAPIIYKLGTPIKTGDGRVFEEIEFLARTYGEIEDVICEQSTVEQAVLLIERVAKPPGLLSMPTWAVDQITMADGVTIANKILPRFLE